MLIYQNCSYFIWFLTSALEISKSHTLTSHTCKFITFFVSKSNHVAAISVVLIFLLISSRITHIYILSSPHVFHTYTHTSAYVWMRNVLLESSLNACHRHDVLAFIFFYYLLIPIFVQSHSSPLLGRTEVYQWECTLRLNNEGRKKNGNFMMKFAPKNTEQREGETLTFECENTVWITTRCLLSVTRRTRWTHNLSDMRSAASLIPY